MSVRLNPNITGDRIGLESLGKSEKKTYLLMIREFMTIPEIAKKRKLSESTIRGHIANLKRKGVLGIVPRQKSDVPPQQMLGFSPQPVRLHGEEFNIKILNPSSKYHSLRTKRSTRYVGQHTVRLYKDSVELYSGVSFWGVSATDCERQSSEYWFKFIQRLENELGVLLLKPSSNNVSRVKAHFAEVGNELARDASRRKERLSVSASEDSREWLLSDGSWGFEELETVHPRTAAIDMDRVIRPFFNDLRDNGVTLPSVMVREAAELRGVVFELGKSIQVTQQQLQTLIALVSPPKSSDGFVDSTLADYFG